jgi:hypothetical protein
MKKVNNERDIQNFIAKFPWLLNLRYQNVPELKKNGYEYSIEGNKRSDLILRDNVTNCPVVVEFKYWNLIRNDIGQILEYKARIFTSFNDENEELYRVFGKNLFSPKLILVVRSSDEYGRIACSLQNIELFEFGNMEEKIINDIPFIKGVEDFSKSLKEHSPPITEDRNEYLQNNVYNIIEELFNEYGISNKWKYYNNYNIGEWKNYKNIFLNRNILPEESVQMGIYEDLLNDKDMSVCIEYWTCLSGEDIKIKKNLEKLEKLLKSNTNLTKDIKSTIDESEEYWLIVKYKYDIFYKNIKKIIDFNLSNYLKIFSK